MTDVCGFEQIEEVGGGLIVKPDADDIRKGLKMLLKDREDLEQKGKLLKDYVAGNYMWDSIINKYISMFKNILS